MMSHIHEEHILGTLRQQTLAKGLHILLLVAPASTLSHQLRFHIKFKSFVVSWIKPRYLASREGGSALPTRFLLQSHHCLDGEHPSLFRDGLVLGLVFLDLNSGGEKLNQYRCQEIG